MGIHFALGDYLLVTSDSLGDESADLLAPSVRNRAVDISRPAYSKCQRCDTSSILFAIASNRLAA